MPTDEIISLQDVIGMVEFVGEELAQVSTATDDSPRWTEMRLFRTSDGRYVLNVIGRSNVYHVLGGPCNAGVPAFVDELPDGAEPCPKCRPPLWDDGDDGDDDPDIEVDLEEDRHAVYVEPDATAVLDRLKNPKASPAGNVRSIMSGPARRLVKIASQHDDDLASSLNVIDRI